MGTQPRSSLRVLSVAAFTLNGRAEGLRRGLAADSASILAGPL